MEKVVMVNKSIFSDDEHQADEMDSVFGDDGLNEESDDDNEIFNLIPETKDVTPTNNEELPQTTDVEKTQTKRRGRPKKNNNVQENKQDVDECNLEQLPLEIINIVYEDFSKLPIQEIQKKTNLTEVQIQKLIQKLKEIFENSVTTGDLTSQNYETYIQPHLTPYVESHLVNFANNVITSIGK